MPQFEMQAGSVSAVVARLLVATLIGLVLGVNRELRDKPAGMRTHGLVALGTATITLTSVQLAFNGSVVDIAAVSRVVQGLTAGVGFLGAGAILHPSDGRVVRGLTTAATLWIAAALGIACGAGAWPVALVSLALALLVLIGGGPVEGLLHQWLGHDEEDRSGEG